MAVTRSAPVPSSARRPHLFWSRLHFLIRLLGVTGALLACFGVFLASIQGKLTQPLTEAAAAWDRYSKDLNAAETVGSKLALTGSLVSQWSDLVVDLGRTAVEQPREQVAVSFLLAGAAAALFALFVEAIVVLCFTATRRSAFGGNALVQVALAAVLLIGVNVWSFSHHELIDCTRDRLYTLPAEERTNLAQLDPKSETTVIVYEMHKTFGKFTEKPDRFDYAAERKVVEKVRELADQLRAVGPQLKVEVLDIEEDGYEERLADLTRNAPELRKSIESAPENSLFFFARRADGRENIQRLSFNDFYLLDKQASQVDEHGRRNLVLLSQGVQPFVRRILSLGAPKPRIGIAVIHDVLATSGDDDWGLQGLRKALEEHGFEVKDILLKRWPKFGMPEAAAYTTDENALDEMEQEEQILNGIKTALEQDQKEIRKFLEVWKKAVNDEKTREELTRRYASRLRGNKITAEIAKDQVAELEDELKLRDIAVQRSRDQLTETTKNKSKLNVNALTEQRRMTDLQAKMARLLGDCDLLFVPRMTLRNTTAGPNISPSLYRMDKAQVDAVKDFLKAGKPLLACLGPSISDPDSRMPDAGQPEPFETMLQELGVQLGKETILFDVEQRAFAERRAGKQFAGSTVRIPSVLFDWRPGQGHPIGTPVVPHRENPIRHSLRLATRGLGKGQELNIRIRLPRPVYYEPPTGVKPDFDPDFLMSDASSWNEEQPFPTAESLPEFTPPKERRGPFPIGIAVQEELPQSWYTSEADKRATARLVVIGQGGFFTGKSIPPAQEKLFVNTVNWLLGRDDQLAHENKVWSYPRVNDTIPPGSETESLWLWGAGLGLPALFGYVGVVVWMFRRLR